ncbi:MAG: hypothetical protein WCP28_15150 [Actinomycetes bacterium]
MPSQPGHFFDPTSISTALPVHLDQAGLAFGDMQDAVPGKAGWNLRVEARTDGLVTRTRNLFASQIRRTPLPN